MKVHELIKILSDVVDQEQEVKFYFDDTFHDESYYIEYVGRELLAPEIDWVELWFKPREEGNVN